MKLKNIICFFSFAFISHAYADMTEKECLFSRFETETVHGVAPFGLFKNILKISKDGCNLIISHEKYKFFKETWNLDVCRTPVHIKKGDSSVHVIKRDGNCEDNNPIPSDFCKNLATLTQVIQDDGLIFAVGSKEDLESEHGKVSCSHMLMDIYLRVGHVYNSSGSGPNTQKNNENQNAYHQNNETSSNESNESEAEPSSTPQTVAPDSTL